MSVHPVRFIPRGRLPLLCVLSVGACTATGRQDALDPAGPQAARIASWFWMSFGLGVACYLIFIALLGYGLLRARRRDRRNESNELPEEVGRRLVLWGGLLVPIPLIMLLLVTSAHMDRRVSRLGHAPGDAPLTIE